MKRRGRGKQGGGKCTSLEDDYQAAMDTALRLLSYRPRTRRELSDRLVRKGVCARTAAEVVSRLEEIGYLDDREFCRSWIKSREGARCRSAWVLKKELREKGVDAELAAEMVDSAFDKEASFRDACDLVRKRARVRKGEKQSKLRKRMQAMLLRRGFGYEFVKEVLGEVLPDERAGET